MRGDYSPFWPAKCPTTIDIPTTNLSFNLQTTAARYPHTKAIIYGEKSISYKELLYQVEQLAAYLQVDCGVQKGDRVLLYTQNSAQYVIGYYAILRADAVVVPVNPMNKTGELKHYIEDSGATVVITTQDVFPNIAPLVGSGTLQKTVVGAYSDCLSGHDSGAAKPNDGEAGNSGRVTQWRDAIKTTSVAPPSQALASDLAVMVYTSGTTGAPKGCMHTHHSIMSGIVGSVCWHGLTHMGVLLATVPMFHVTGMQTNMNTPIYLGNTVVILQRWDPEAAVRLIEQHKVSEWTAIATMIIDILALKDVSADSLSSLRYLRGGGAPMPENVAKRLDELLGLKYIEGYGLSETVAAMIFNPPSHPKRQCAGIPMFNVDARIVDPETMDELPLGEVGEILLSGEQVFVGYWKRPDADAETFVTVDNAVFMRTGDLGYIDNDGYFFIVDRLKRMINASGFKVWPAEVENALYEHPAIGEACVIAAHDAHRGETVKAIIVLRPESKDKTTSDDIIQWAKNRLAAYKYPRQIEFRDSLPRSSTGKVLWRELQEQERVASTSLAGKVSLN
jgi:fatty-acyl-CoA synthase